MPGLNLDRLYNGITNYVLYGLRPNMSDRQFLQQAIQAWKQSRVRELQLTGQLYYQGEHDILRRERTVIGETGELVSVDNLPNNKILDNQYAKLVDQKTNYLLGKPFTIQGDNDAYVDALNGVFNKQFIRTLRNTGKAALNHGIAWIYPYYGQDGKFKFRLFPGYEILPFWTDNEHSELIGAVRTYLVDAYDGTRQVTVEKAEVYDLDGIHCYILDNNSLIPDMTDDRGADCAYVMANGQPFNWEKIPLVPFKYNDEEIPLIKRVKCLQDAINMVMSDFENNMQEDARNTILVLRNYDGENLGEFRRNLATYGAVKVRYDGETKGGVETLNIEVNSQNYQTLLEMFRKSIIENGLGYDAKDDRLSGNPNQMNIQSMYSDIDLDAHGMETEFQAAFEQLLWFVNAYLANTGQGSFDGEDIDIIFNRDVLINESEIIANIQASTGILSDETLIAHHPWVQDPRREMDLLEEQQQKEQEQANQYNPFGQNQNGQDDTEVTTDGNEEQ